MKRRERSKWIRERGKAAAVCRLERYKDCKERDERARERWAGYKEKKKSRETRGKKKKKGTDVFVCGKEESSNRNGMEGSSRLGSESLSDSLFGHLVDTVARKGKKRTRISG